jgi:hypothetical protein
MKVYSVENGHGGQGVCRAKNIEEVTAEIETAKQENRLARLVRDDGETLIINPDKVFLIGELNLS